MAQSYIPLNQTDSRTLSNAYDFAEDAIEPLIVEKAKDYRKDNPGLGCVKLYIIISTLFKETGCMPGRDAFIEILGRMV